MNTERNEFGWFKLADYQVSGGLKPSDWAEMLSRRNAWQTDFLSHPWRLSGASPRSIKDDRIQNWHDYLADVLPCNLGAPRPESCPGTPVALRPITDITESFGDFTDTGRPADFEVSFLGARVLVVNTRAPDTDLKKGFNAWLAEQRKNSPLPARRRGRPSTNLELTPGHFASWSQYNVLAVIDLDFYAQVFGIDCLTHEELASDFLECHRDVDPKEWGRNARDKAKEAMECLGLLETQTQAKASAGEGGPK